MEEVCSLEATHRRGLEVEGDRSEEGDGIERKGGDESKKEGQGNETNQRQF
jgi:hypothetical protein